MFSTAAQKEEKKQKQPMEGSGDAQVSTNKKTVGWLYSELTNRGLHQAVVVVA